MSEDLKPCLCGSPMTLFEYENAATKTLAKFEIVHGRAYSEECFAVGQYEVFFATRAEAITAWNRRATDAQPDSAEQSS